MKSAKNLAIVFNTLEIGGIETKIIDLCRYYSLQKNIRLTIFLKQPVGQLINQVPQSVKILSPPSPSPLGFLFWLARNLPAQSPDLVITFGNYSSICTLLAKGLSFSRFPVVISEDSSINLQLKSEKFSLIRTLLLKITYPFAAQIITLTDAGKKKLSRLIPKAESKITIIPNWLSQSFETDTPPTTKKNIDLLFLGRFEPQKKPLDFLKISLKLLKDNPRLKIFMVGQGSLQTQIENFIKANHLSSRISIKPATTNPQAYYQRSKILLLTSQHEGFPLTILESSALGCLPVCRQLPEVDAYFDFHHELVLYSSLPKAVRNLHHLFAQPQLITDICSYYSQKTLSSQSLNFSSTINLFQQYL